MTDLVQGQSYTIAYTKSAEDDASRSFFKLHMRQATNQRTHAVHYFQMADQKIARKIYNEFLAKEEIKFAIRTQHAESDWYTHAPLIGIIHDTFSGGDDSRPVVEIHTLDKASSKMLKNSRSEAVQSGGKIEDAIRAVCQKTGTKFRVVPPFDAQAIEEFKVLYQPGCSDWDFVAKYLTPRAPIAAAVGLQGGDTIMLFDRSKPNTDELAVPKGFAANVRTMDTLLDIYARGGEEYSSHWVSPLDGKVHQFSNGSEPTTRQVICHKYNKQETARAVLTGRNMRKDIDDVQIVEILAGGIRPGKFVAPGVTIRGESPVGEGFLAGVDHLLEDGSYKLTLIIEIFEDNN